MGEPPKLPGWLAAEVAEWPEDAFGVREARLLLRDGSVIAPVAILPSGDVVGWGDAGAVPFAADDIVAVERLDG